MAKEKKSTKATIDECDYRVGEHCLRPAIKAAREAAGALPPGADSAREERLAIRKALVRALKTGEALRRCKVVRHRRCPSSPPKPHYDGDLHALFLGKVCLHQFGGQAGDVVVILEALEARGWPRLLVNPLGDGSDPNYGKWLKSAVRRLNEGQKKAWLIHFHSRPKAHVVWWELRLR
jgi:hypothetical protein